MSRKMLNIRIATKDDQTYIVESHSQIYKKERNFDESFKEFIEASVSNIFSPVYAGEVWLLEKKGKPCGSIAVSLLSRDVAQLRLFLIEPSGRGQGGAKQLMDQAINYAKDQGVSEMILWTSSNQEAARTIYEKYGFVLTESKTSFLSKQYVEEEKWTMALKKEVRT